MAASTSGAGWWPDPSGRHEHRHWDGSSWTSWVADGPTLLQDEDFDPSLLEPPAAPFQNRFDASTIPRWAWILGAILLVGLIGNLTGGGDDDSNDDSSSSNDTALYVDFAECYADLLDTGLCADIFDPSDSYLSYGQCYDDTIEPDFCAAYFEEPTPSTSPPTPPTVPPTAPPVQAAPLPPSNCNANYTGCVANASDVDCAGGSGDGPEYTGTVQVIGSDVYDLDSDGDGTGCE